MNLHQAILYGEELLRKSKIDQPRWNSERLLLLALKQDRAHAYSDLSREMSPEEWQSFDYYVRKRAEFYPLSYIEGTHEFFGRIFSVNEHVLIPRPETEEIIRAVLELPLPKSARILDLGSGTGNIPVTLSHEIPDSVVYALELDSGALEVLKLNAGGKLHLIRGDFYSPPFLKENFDVITSNPPYVEESTWESLPAETRWEPRLALITKDLEQTYSDLLRVSELLLRPNGYLVFEIGFDQEFRIRKICDEQSALHLLKVRRDQAGIPRTFVLRK
jgi:release factor glutamine methyltransferase